MAKCFSARISVRNNDVEELKAFVPEDTVGIEMKRHFFWIGTVILDLADETNLQEVLLGYLVTRSRICWDYECAKTPVPICIVLANF